MLKERRFCDHEHTEELDGGEVVCLDCESELEPHEYRGDDGDVPEPEYKWDGGRADRLELYGMDEY